MQSANDACKAGSCARRASWGHRGPIRGPPRSAAGEQGRTARRGRRAGVWGAERHVTARTRREAPRGPSCRRASNRARRRRAAASRGPPRRTGPAAARAEARCSSRGGVSGAQRARGGSGAGAGEGEGEGEAPGEKSDQVGGDAQHVEHKGVEHDALLGPDDERAHVHLRRGGDVDGVAAVGRLGRVAARQPLDGLEPALAHLRRTPSDRRRRLGGAPDAHRMHTDATGARRTTARRGGWVARPHVRGRARTW